MVNDAMYGIARVSRRAGKSWASGELCIPRIKSEHVQIQGLSCNSACTLIQTENLSRSFALDVSVCV